MTRTTWELSSREIDVARLIAGGQTNEEIAKALGIAVRTTRSHVSEVYAKLEVHTRSKAVIRCSELYGNREQLYRIHYDLAELSAALMSYRQEHYELHKRMAALDAEQMELRERIVAALEDR